MNIWSLSIRWIILSLNLISYDKQASHGTTQRRRKLNRFVIFFLPFSLRLIAISTLRYFSQEKQEEIFLSFNWLIKRAESKWWVTRAREKILKKAQFLKVNNNLASFKLSNSNWQLFRFSISQTKLSISPKQAFPLVSVSASTPIKFESVWQASFREN